MNKLLVLLALVGVVGCSSSKKEDMKEHAHQQAEQAQEESQESIDRAKEAVEQAAEEMKTEAEKKAKDYSANSNDSDEDSPTTFPDYTGTESSKVTCTNGDDTRMASVLNGESGGCGVVYNKFGADKTVAVAEFDMNYCTEVQNKIKSNLEGAGFTCQ